MIEATLKKLREAKFFLSLLNRESQKTVRNGPESFEFYLNAFLSAARSVTFALRSALSTWSRLMLGSNCRNVDLSCHSCFQ